MAKVVCVLYDDPVTGYPKSYARDDVPELERYPDGQSLPSPKGIDLARCQAKGSPEGESKLFAKNTGVRNQRERSMS